MKKVLVNLKMYQTSKEEVEKYINDLKGENVILFPSFIYLEKYIENGFTCGAQNISTNCVGAYTSEISVKSLKDLNVKYVLIGHSEVRKNFNEKEEDICRKVIDLPHNQYLVCNGSLDNVVGVTDSKSLLGKMMSDQKFSLKDDGLVHPVQMVPDTLTLSEILDNFKRTHSDIAVIINEYALVVGIITLNDVMSTVMGDLVSNEEESQILEREDGSWLVDGSTPVEDLERLLNVGSLPDDNAYETVAGFMMYMLRKIPKRTDRVVYGGYRFEVIDVDNNKVDQVLVAAIKPESKTTTQPPAS